MKQMESEEIRKRLISLKRKKSVFLGVRFSVRLSLRGANLLRSRNIFFREIISAIAKISSFTDLHFPLKVCCMHTCIPVP